MEKTLYITPDSPCQLKTPPAGIIYRKSCFVSRSVFSVRSPEDCVQRDSTRHQWCGLKWILSLLNLADRGFKLIGLLRAYEQFFAVAQYKLHAFIAAYVIRLTVSKAASNPPAAIFPYRFIPPGVIFSQIFRPESLEVDVERKKTYIQTVRLNLGLKLQK